MMLYIPSTYMSSGKIVCLHPTISATITHVFYTLAVLRAEPTSCSLIAVCSTT